jgi:hypothetical protein
VRSDSTGKRKVSAYSTEYIRIEKVLDQGYGKFFEVWSKDGISKPAEVTKGLGEVWEVENYVVKEYSVMGAVQTPVECCAAVRSTFLIQSTIC